MEVDQERRGYLRLVAKGHMSEEELEKTLAALNEVRRTAGRKLEAIGERWEEIERPEHDRDALLASWSEAVPEDLNRLTPEERSDPYRTPRLEGSPAGEGYEVTGPFCSLEPSSS